MSNMEVGEYIRTKKGLIFKATEYWLNECNTMNIEENIFKHSFNIIDLIEEGDYVNGCRVINILSDEEYKRTLVKCINNNCFWKDDIKTIVTKEQFKEMEYRI